MDLMLQTIHIQFQLHFMRFVVALKNESLCGNCEEIKPKTEETRRTII